jgi:hypothetical protein
VQRYELAGETANKMTIFQTKLPKKRELLLNMVHLIYMVSGIFVPLQLENQNVMFSFRA